MKINNIKALDYNAQGSRLVLTLTDTSLEQITSMDVSLIRVTTDAGDLVDAFAGYRLARVTYETETAAFLAVLEQGTSDTTAAALAQISAELVAARGEVTALQQSNADLSSQLQELTGAVERGLAL